MTDTPACEFRGCSGARKNRGLCPGHAAQRRRGVPLTALAPRAPRGATASERLAASSREVEGGCRVWTGQIVPGTGYGRLTFRGKATAAHVLAFESAFGPVPPGHEVDHSCRNRACVHTSHLFARTRKQNAENRGVDARNTSGARGVSWHRRSGKWAARVKHHGKTHWAGLHESVDAAAEAARALRNELFTNNLADRREGEPHE